MASEFSSLQEFRARYKFDVYKPIGKGGFGEVYKAVDVATNEFVAVKKSQVMPSHERYSLMEEVELGKGLSHENLIRYISCDRFSTDVGLFDFGVMEYANGGDLEQFLRTLPNMDKLRMLFKGVLKGLDHLHGHQIVHRDLKPANILVHYEDNRVIPKIIDFGISKKMSSDESVISSVIGSCEYMSPEQLGAGDGRITPNSDLWTFGVIVCHLFLDELPFGSFAHKHTREKIINNILQHKLIIDLDDMPEPYNHVARMCLVKDPRHRVATAKDILRVLDGDLAPLEDYEKEVKRKAEPKKKVNPRLIDISDLELVPNPPPKPIRSEEEKKKSASRQSIKVNPDPPKIKPVGAGTRFGAFILDAIITGVLFVPGLLVMAAQNLSLMDEDGVIIFGFACALPAFLYFTTKDGFKGGHSPGKRMVGIRVLDAKTGKPINVLWSFFRNLVLLLLLILPAFIFGGSMLFLILAMLGMVVEIITILGNPQNKGIEDLLTGTIVTDE